MQCSQCPLVEMRIISSEGNSVTFKCPKCNQIKTISKEETKEDN